MRPVQLITLMGFGNAYGQTKLDLPKACRRRIIIYTRIEKVINSVTCYDMQILSVAAFVETGVQQY